jgi:pSer/pThr/pTyr-binding forkhead associated (FHA) protein
MSLTISFLSGSKAGQTATYKEGKVRVGRLPDNDIVFDPNVDIRVSGHHAEIKTDGSSWWIDDKGSTNGPRVNGNRVFKLTQLYDGDLLEFGAKGVQAKLSISGQQKAVQPRQGKKTMRRVMQDARESANAQAENQGRGAAGRTMIFMKELVRQSTLESTSGVKGLIALMTVVFVAVAGVGGWWVVHKINDLSAENRNLKNTVAEQEAAAATREAEASARVEQERRQREAIERKLNDMLRTGVSNEDTRAALERFEAAQREAIAQGRADYEKKIAELEARLANQKNDGSAAAAIASLKDEVDRLRTERESLVSGTREGAFKAIQKKIEPALYLIFSQVEFKNARGEVRTMQGFGTGFMVTSNGHIVTNKHVVQPYKFAPEKIDLEEGGFTEKVLDTELICAWQVGVRFRADEARLELATSFNTAMNTLTIMGTAPDSRQEVESARGRKHIVHGVADNNDICILKARGTGLPHVECKTEGVESLDPVMVLGFPKGAMIMEHESVVSSPSLGNVRSVQDTIQVSAPIIPGNSGGPLIGIDGRVIGIATRVVTDTETLGMCIKVEHALKLIPRR